METRKADLTIIGAGPGGYVAAIRAAQLGLKPVLVELGEERLGGVCLNCGCVPTKSLLHTVRAVENVRKLKARGVRLDGDVAVDLEESVARSRTVVDTLRRGIAFLLKRARVETIYGRARLVGHGRVEIEGTGPVESGRVILAAGGRPKPLPFAPFDGELILSTTHALSLARPPGEAAVIGAGASGMEIAAVWAACGSKVTVLEILDHALPFMDEEAARVVARSFRKRGIRLMTSTTVTGVEKRGGRVAISWRKGDEEGRVEADRLLVATGTAANIEDLWDASLGIEVDRGFVKTGEAMQTSVPSVYAIGDLAGPPLLAHAASWEGLLAVESIAGRPGHAGIRPPVPSVVYVLPHVAQVGLSEKEASEKGIAVKVGRFPFSAASMAVAQEETDGFVKIVSDAKTSALLGAVVAGAGAGELIGELATAVTAGMSAEALVRTIHPHPTLGEAIHEAALDIHGMAIHKV
jgi:dihydrolipoamide dehydrogenase